ncbi:transporter [Shewanella hanedai]|jgi:small conductance mechanosensitive channel|uniref:Small-conductance mechanosensitive channel n=1 Tax=Shewanella hanedai TaxID=25 RepID=A0A553JIU7_SHEHA|nr:mechanosensitive ion channel domain-containing protein [Shewanella hanedai]TRY12384.1 mechanosensitive ion channel [Shewanella hanedai]GGI97182.1 transporter [Shewanella hanedai]
MKEDQLEQELQQLQGVYNIIYEFLVQYSFQLIGAFFIFLLGLWVANKVSNLVASQLKKHDIDITLSNFVTNLLRILIIVMVGIVCLGKLGISITPMVAAIGAASLGAGLALQGMLSNYAAGITIIVTRPFVVGNTISIKDVTGVVKDIYLGMTVLINEEGEQINIPNKHIVGEILHNSFANKLVETKFNISYKSDPDEVIALATEAVTQCPRVYHEQSPLIGINDFNSIGIEISIRYWVPTDTYYQDKYHANLAIYRALLAANIEIPCPVREIHIES